MPTGGGKSLCYQIPALLREGVTIVVSPLIALMADQVAGLEELGIPAAYLNSALSWPQQRDVQRQLAAGNIKLLYVAPERLVMPGTVELLKRIKVGLFAIDEAHCVSMWGHDFRPEYGALSMLREQWPDVPRVALTATADLNTRREIVEKLLIEPKEFVASFDRPNIRYRVAEKRKPAETLRELVDFIKEEHAGDTGIVYCMYRATTEDVAKTLCSHGLRALAYHGGMTHEERTANLETFLREDGVVMVATIAFGMGIDKPDVRFVAHYTMCDSLESYYQEAGRAGRDGVRSYALLLTSPDDGGRIVKRFEQEFPPLEKIKDIYEKVCSYLQIGIGDGAEASFLFNIHDFCAREHLYSGTVQSALKLLQQNGYMTLTDAQENPARIMFCVSRDDLYRIRVQRDELDHFIRTLLRLYNGVFTEFRQIDEGEIATWSGYTVERVKELLKRLWQLRVIRYVPSNRSPILFMNEERLPRADLYISPDTYKRRQELMRERFEHMLDYAANETRCRSAVLEAYFGEGDPAPCGVCDICLARRRAAKQKSADAAGNAAESLRKEVLKRLAQGPADPRELADGFPGGVQRTGEVIRQLLDEGLLATGKDGKIRLK